MAISLFAAWPAPATAQARDGARPARPDDHVYDDAEQLRAYVQGVVADYVARMERAGIHPTYIPRIEIENTPMMIAFLPPRMVVPFWPDLSQEQRARLAILSVGEGEGRNLFGAFFNWFLLAHEMTHFLQEQVGGPVDRYEDERMANEFAVAYWMERDPSNDERLAALEGVIQLLLRRMPNPVPAAEDERDYFRDHYWEIVRSPAQAYYQMKFIRAALSKRNELDFDALMRRYAASVAAADVPLHEDQEASALATGRYVMRLGKDELSYVPPERRSEVVGQWTLVFSEPDSFRLSHDDEEIVVGRYQADSEQLALVEGDLAFLGCAHDPQPRPGRYRWTVNKDDLRLAVVRDSCQGRQWLLTRKPFHHTT